MKLIRSPNLVAYWREGLFQIEDFEKRRRVHLAPIGVLLLDEFTRPRDPARVARSFSRFTPASVRAEIRKLCRLELLVPRGQTPQRSPRGARDGLAGAWHGSVAAAYYHFSTRDLPFESRPRAVARILGRLVESSRQPPLYKDYPSKRRVALPQRLVRDAVSLTEVLGRRRTVRTFDRRAVPFGVFVSTIRETWGQTGWIESPPFGYLLTKSSPSGGARHPIECYVLAWRVGGLAPGLYHYSVRRDDLDMLRRGRLADQAVGIASGQQWIRGAAFVCLMTAVVERTFWKYSPQIGYRALYLDAGHLAQTFCLVATAVGLGPFTTAALQQSKAERLLGIDGVHEFPIYLCGAGFPAPRSGAGLPATS